MDDTAPTLPTPRRFVPLVLITAALVAASWVCSSSLAERAPNLADTRTGVPITVPADRIVEPQDAVEAPPTTGDVPTAEASAVAPPHSVVPLAAGIGDHPAGGGGADDDESNARPSSDASVGASANGNVGPSDNANANAHAAVGGTVGQGPPGSKH